MAISHLKKKPKPPICEYVINKMSLKKVTSWTSKGVPAQGAALPATHERASSHTLLSIGLVTAIPETSCLRTFAHSAPLVELWFIPLPAPQTKFKGSPCLWSLLFLLSYFFFQGGMVRYQKVHDLQNIVWWAWTTAHVPHQCTLTVNCPLHDSCLPPHSLTFCWIIGTTNLISTD